MKNIRKYASEIVRNKHRQNPSGWYNNTHSASSNVGSFDGNWNFSAKRFFMQFYSSLPLTLLHRTRNFNWIFVSEQNAKDSLIFECFCFLVYFLIGIWSKENGHILNFQNGKWWFGKMLIRSTICVEHFWVKNIFNLAISLIWNRLDSTGFVIFHLVLLKLYRFFFFLYYFHFDLDTEEKTFCTATGTHSDCNKQRANERARESARDRKSRRLNRKG